MPAADTLRAHAQAEEAGAAALDAVDGLNTQVSTLTADKATLAARVAELQKQLEQQSPTPAPTGDQIVVYGPVVVIDRPASTKFFDTAFEGATASEKVVSLNAWMQERQKKPGPIEPVLFDSKAYSTSAPIQNFSGFRFLSPDPTPAREFSRGTVLKWTGKAGTSLFAPPPVPQAGQSYPGDGSARNMSFSSIQFEGPAGTHCIPPSDRGDYRGKTFWYFDWHNCGWKGFDSVWRGTSTGCTISGISHFQGLGDEPLVLGGAETALFVGGYSFVDSKRMTAGAAFLRSSLSKSQIGLVMFTGRQDIVPVILDGGEATRLEGTRIDAQDSDPINGAGLRITGGSGHIISAGFKGVGAKAGAVKGWIEITGGTDHLVDRSAFLRKGTSPAPLTLPAVYVGGTAERIKVGLNVFPGWGGAKPIVQQTKAGKVVACTDPTVQLLTAA